MVYKIAPLFIPQACLSVLTDSYCMKITTLHWESGEEEKGYYLNPQVCTNQHLRSVVSDESLL